MEVWGPQIGEVTCRGSLLLSCKRDQIKMRDYEDRRVTHQSGLPHLPGVPHLHVNRPLMQRLFEGALKTIVIPLSAVLTRISAAARIKFPKCGAYLSNHFNL